MKIVIFGLTVSSSWGNGHATIWRGLCRALSSEGHEVTFFERDVPYYARHRDFTNAADFNVVLYESWDEVLPIAERTLAEADSAFITSYCPDANSAAELVLPAKSLRRIFYDLDTPVTLKTLDTEGHVDYIPDGGLGPFDLVLSYTGGQALEELKCRLGAQRVAPLYGSVDPQVHHPEKVSERYQSDLSYLGTFAADRQAQLERLFLQPAHLLAEKKFLLGGSLYPENFPWTSNVFFTPHVPPPEHSCFYSSSRLTLNITRAAMAEMGYCPSGRLFEAAACGVPVVSDYWEGLESFFDLDSEILLADKASDVVEALSQSDEVLARVGFAARQRTLSEHTAQHRAAELSQLLQGI